MAMSYCSDMLRKVLSAHRCGESCRTPLSERVSVSRSTPKVKPASSGSYIVNFFGGKGTLTEESGGHFRTREQSGILSYSSSGYRQFRVRSQDGNSKNIIHLKCRSLSVIFNSAIHAYNLPFSYAEKNEFWSNRYIGEQFPSGVSFASPPQQYSSDKQKRSEGGNDDCTNGNNGLIVARGEFEEPIPDSLGFALVVFPIFAPALALLLAALVNIWVGVFLEVVWLLSVLFLFFGGLL